MKHQIVFTNLQKEKSPFRGYQSALRRAIEKTLEWEKVSFSAHVEVTLVSSEEICRLNREFRGVDRPTDVLSFPTEEEGFENEPIVCLGDIILCPAVIAAQAEGYGATYRQEMCLMAIHSTLHLLGWDHMEEKEKEEMFSLQEEIMKSLSEGEVKTETQYQSKTE